MNRKPRDLRFKTGPIAVLGCENIGPNKGTPFVIMRDDAYDDQYGVPNSEQCRKYADWFIRMADYIDSRKKK